MLGVSRTVRKCHFSKPKLLDAPVVAITKNSNFVKKFFSKDDLGHKYRYVKLFFGSKQSKWTSVLDYYLRFTVV
jgi:hypothetical protein